MPSCFSFVKICLCQLNLLSRCSARYWARLFRHASTSVRGANLREWADQNWLNVQVFPAFHSHSCKMFLRTPGYAHPRLKNIVTLRVVRVKRKRNPVVSNETERCGHIGLGPESDSELPEYVTDPSSRQGRCPTTWRQQMAGARHQDRLTIGRNVIWTCEVSLTQCPGL
jgi:hypothetical protein